MDGTISLSLMREREVQVIEPGKPTVGLFMQPTRQSEEASFMNTVMRGSVLIILMVGFTTRAVAATVTNSLMSYYTFHALDQDDVGDGSCGPTAAVNSFAYLQARFPDTFGRSLIPEQGSDLNEDDNTDLYDDMIATARKLAGTNYMDTPGVTFNEFVNAKRDYLADQGLESDLSVVGTGLGLSLQWLNDQLKKGSDVELLINDTGDAEDPTSSHWVTVTSVQWEDDNNNGVPDPGEVGEIGFIDPDDPESESGANVRQVDGQTYPFEVEYLNGWHYCAAVAEQVPEPGANLLFLLGLGSVACLSRFGRRCGSPS
jgi:hypothetical protein